MKETIEQHNDHLLTALENEKSKWQSTISRMDQELRIAGKKITDMRKSSVLKTNEIMEQVVELEERNNVLNERCFDLEQTLCNLRIENARLVSETMDLWKRLAEAVDSEDDIKTKMSQLGVRLNDIQLERSVDKIITADKLNQLEKKTQTLETKCETLQATAAANAKKMTELYEQNKNLKTERRRLRRERLRLNSEMSKLREELESEKVLRGVLQNRFNMTSDENLRRNWINPRQRMQDSE